MMERLILASISGTVGLAMVALLCLLAKRLPASVRCWLWRLAILKMALSLVWVLDVPVLRTTPMVVDESMTKEVADVPPAPTAGRQPALPVRREAMPPVSSPDRSDPWQTAWIAGMIVVGGAILLRFEQSRRAVTRSQPATSVDQLVDALARQAGVRSPRVLRVEGAPIALHGVVRPTIVVPSDHGELGAALAHEMAHLKRRDPAWSTLLTLAALPFWFLPPIWLALRAHRDTVEEATDQLALRWGVGREALAHALMNFASGRVSSAMALGGGGRKIAWRIKRLYVQPWSNRRSLATLCGLSLPLAIALLPWRAVAADLNGPPDLRERSLDRASLNLLRLPEVRQDLGYTDSQWQAKKPEFEAWKRRFDAFAAKLADMQRRQASDIERAQFDSQNRTKLFRERDEISLEVLHRAQLERLRQLGLQYYGAVIMAEPTVAKELGLSSGQLQVLASLKKEYRESQRLNARDLGLSDGEKDLSVLTAAERARYVALVEKLKPLSGEARRKAFKDLWPLEVKMMNPRGEKHMVESSDVRRRRMDERNARLVAARKTLTRRMLRSMSPTQRDRWAKMTGKPFVFKPISGIGLP